MPDLTVIMPVYNEEKIIAEVVAEWLEELRDLNVDFEIKIYNDGSIDNSMQKLKELGDRHKELMIIDKSNSGHGATILEGYRSSHSKWILQVDSDDEIDTNHFVKLWEKRKDYDFILGERKNRNAGLSRKIITLISSLTIGIFFGLGIKDINVPFRLYRRDKFSDVFKIILPNTFAPNVILSGYAVKKRLRIFNCPVLWRKRRTGTVSIQKMKLLRVAIRSWIELIKFRYDGMKSC